jgi:hypothetical protein
MTVAIIHYPPGTIVVFHGSAGSVALFLSVVPRPFLPIDVFASLARLMQSVPRTVSLASPSFMPSAEKMRSVRSAGVPLLLHPRNPRQTVFDVRVGECMIQVSIAAHERDDIGGISAWEPGYRKDNVTFCYP